MVTGWSELPPEGFSVRRVVLLACLAALLGGVSYVNALDNPFVYDDVREIVENPSIGDLTDVPAIWRHYPTRPLTNLSYAVDFAIGGLRPLAFHATSVALHVVNVVLLFVLAWLLAGDSVPSHPRRAGIAALTAFMAASLFAVHPLMTQAVAYVSGRAEVLVTAFCLASVLCFRAAAVGGPRGYLAAGLAFFVLAVGTKETAVMLPALLIAYERCFVRSAGGKWSILTRMSVPLVVAAMVIAAFRVWRYLGVEHPDAAGFNWMYLLLEIHVFERYLSLLFFPIGQSLVPAITVLQSPLDIRLLMSVGVIGLMITAGVATRRRQPMILFGITWFFLMLLPSAALIVIADRGEPMAEHRAYLPSCGFFLACAAFAALALHTEAALFRKRLVAVIVGLGVVLPALMALTVARNRVWSDPVRLLEDAVRKAPDVWLAQYGLGDAYRAQGDCESATAAYRRAIALRPQNADGYLALAQCLLDGASLGAGREALRGAIAHAPDDARAYLALAALEERHFSRPEEALRLCQEALRLTPRSGEAQECVSRLTVRRGR